MKLLRSVLLPALVLVGCGGGEPQVAKKHDKPLDAELPEYDLEIPMVTYAWDPQAGDPKVPAELGGPGFTGEGWETNMTFPALGQPGAPKGGRMNQYMPDWPATLRMTGKDSNTSFNYAVADLAYESLLDLHPTTAEYVPRLATHWQISDDKTTYRFRINPEARWSDGSEVTSADVVATWKLLVDPTLLYPSTVVTFGKLHEPVAVSKYIVEVKVKEESWRNFLYFGASMKVFPAKDVSIAGSEYLDKYQFAYTANSGPYHVLPADIDTGKSITITRRDDWWAKDNPAYDGIYNIDRFKHNVVKEPGLAFEKLKKGELDYMVVPKAQWWAEEIPSLDAVKRGMLVPRKFFNDNPNGTSGIAINTTRAPLDDVRIRKALQHLYDRETMIEKLFFDEYEPLTSYWQGEVYGNPDNELIPYDEIAAVELLEEAGWTETNDQGYRVKDGKVLEFTLSYASPLSERSLTVFQESAKLAGIKLDLQLLTPAAAWKNLTEKEYQLHDAAWGALLFPNPESSWHSRLADQKGNNNVTAFKNARVDELCAEYDRTYDQKRRAEIVREMDGIIYNEHPYVLGWYQPAQRVAFWNKFGMPSWGIPRYEDGYGGFVVWWVDPEKEKQLEAARKDSSLTMDAGAQNNLYWKAWAKAGMDAKLVAARDAAEATDGEVADDGGAEQ